jgi:hypothetical protein
MQSIAKEVAGLRQMGVGSLQSRYAELFGESTRAGNKAWLIKRIAWRIQALEERVRLACVAVGVTFRINHEVQVLSPQRPQAAKCLNGGFIGRIERPNHPHSLFLAQFVEFPPHQELLKLLIERLAVDLRLKHSEPPQGDHFADQTSLSDTRNWHSQDVAVLGFD